MKRPDIYELIAYANELGLIVALAPSATPLLTDAALEQAKDAGLHRISLSIDGPNALVHDRQRGVEGTFQRTVELLQAAQAIGLDRQINTTILQANHQHLIEMADLAEWLHVSLWSVFMLVPTGRAEQSVMLAAVGHEKVYRDLARLLDNDAYSFDIKTTAGQPFYRVLAQQKERRTAGNAEVGVRLGL